MSDLPTVSAETDTLDDAIIAKGIKEKKGDVSCPAFEFIYIYFSFTLS
jgi:hypothetical protein